MPRSPRQKRPPRPLNSANIIGVIGASGTGKGLYCKERLRASASAPLTLIWSPLEQTDRYAALLSAKLTGSIPALVDAIRGGSRCVVYVPKPDQVAEQFELFCRIVWECESCRALVEEVGRVTSPGYAPTHWRNLTTAGRHRRIELIATAQRPAHIDKDFVGNCTEVRCFRVNYEEDARAMARVLRVPFDTLMDLPDLHYIHRNLSERVNVTGTQGVPIGG